MTRATPRRRGPSFAVLALAALAFASLALAACTPGVTPSPTAPLSSGVRGVVRAGPTCPVEPAGDTSTACAPRAVSGAVIVVLRGDVEAGRATSEGDGHWFVRLPAGDYTVEPQPVKGLVGTAPAQHVTVNANSWTNLDIEYDTGIR